MRAKVLNINELNINKHSGKSKVKCLEIPHYAYTWPLCIMKTTRMRLMKFTPFIFTVVILTSCATAQDTKTPDAISYTIEYLNIVENDFGGNIVLEVYDSNGNHITDYQTILKENGKVIFDVPQKDYNCTFFEDGKSVTIEILKDGYKPFITKPFATDDELELANYIKVTLVKE